MSGPQRTLLVAFSLSAVTAVGFVLVQIGGGETATQAPLTVTPGPAPRPTPQASPSIGGPDRIPSGDRIRSESTQVTDDEICSLVVRVANEQGASISDARITIKEGSDVAVEGQGALEWREARPGRLSLLVEAEGLLPYRRDLDLEAGERQRITAQLLDHIPLRGRAVDSHGLAVANASIWLLGGGEAHPVEGANLKDRLRAVTNKSGEFGIEIPAEGSWRFSAGPPGEILATSEALDLSLGGPSNLEVVLPGRGLLDVRLDNVPEGVRNGSRILRLVVLKERDPERMLVENTEEQQRRRRRAFNENRKRRLSAGDLPEGAATAPEPSRWKEIESLPIGRDGTVRFTDLPTGVPLHLAMLRKKDRFESPSSFVLQPDRASVARFPVPPVRTPEEIAAQPVTSFHPVVLVESVGEPRRTGICLVD